NILSSRTTQFFPHVGHVGKSWESLSLLRLISPRSDLALLSFSCFEKVLMGAKIKKNLRL
ncbi:MAG TPA: hypothetical protein PL034_00925, partial [Candidatus Paceibacterota bacterium]|nr:hypothetical protein [Candidatus Paceibacterota bacterium]